MDKKTLNYGRWPSNISAQFVAGKALRFQTVQALEDTLYWTEQRPFEKGRTALVRARPGAPSLDLVDAPFSVNSKVHEYGGGAFLATAIKIFFINGEDQQIWSLDHSPNSEKVSNPTQITDATCWRFADLFHDESGNRLICVGEFHTENQHHPQNLLVSIALDEETPRQINPLRQGADFYASPKLSPDRQQLAFISWNLPDMPWEKAQLHIADYATDGTLTNTRIPDCFPAGAFFAPEWDDKGDLWFINDEEGYGQLYRFDGKNCSLYSHKGAETGAPMWNFAMKTYGFLDTGHIACIASVTGQPSLLLLDPTLKKWSPLPGIDKDICALDQLVTLHDRKTGHEMIAGILSCYDQPDAIAARHLKSGKITILKASASFDFPPADTSIAEMLTFKNELGQTVYGTYYAPANHAVEGPKEQCPPVIMTAHGGPTAFSNAGLKPKIQFWTSRGFGYFDVNYSGSWGFGKAYRQRLDGQWGVRDVADMEAGARYLIKAGLADPARLLISGSSAGGYTVLMALITSDIFAAGASYYGISDLARLMHGTHKFEAGYIESLLGLTPENQEQKLQARSPLFLAAKITSPVIFFQGLQDKVVPPEQAELMVKALKKQGINTRYKTFEHEGHGFRNQHTIETSLMMEYQFYMDILAL